MLEPYMKIEGALRTKRFRAVLDEDMVADKGTKFESDIEGIYEYNAELRDTTIVLSQFMRSFSAMWPLLDMSAMDPDTKAGIDAMVLEMAKYSTLGDEVFGDYGMEALTDMLERQEQLATIYTSDDVTIDSSDEPTERSSPATDVFKGLKALGHEKP